MIFYSFEKLFSILKLSCNVVKRSSLRFCFVFVFLKYNMKLGYLVQITLAIYFYPP